MIAGQKRNVYLILGLIVLSAAVLAPTFLRDSIGEKWISSPMKLGLDLKGGSYLVLGVQTEEAVKSTLATIASSVRSEFREEKIGLVRAKQSGDRSVVFTLLGDRGVERLTSFMAENYRELGAPEVTNEGAQTLVRFSISDVRSEEIKKNAVLQAIETIRNRVDQYGVAEPTIQRTGEERIMVQLPEVTNVDQVKKSIGSVAKLEFRLVANPGTPADQTVTRKTREGASLVLEDEVAMSGDAVETATVDINPQNNGIEVSLKLNSTGKAVFARVTRENVRRQLAIVLDGVVQSAPVINDAITGGTAVISGGFTREEAHRLSVVLRSGALPAPLTFEEERTVGASLGADSIQKGVLSMVVGALAVLVFTPLYYRKAGLLAVGCLAVNMLLLLALLAWMQATLTLPGIAGLVLTLGMAVDANIIIYERIREELKLGATARAAVEAGFEKAHWTILDANITTMLTGIILYSFGTGPIKGFAVTLCLGIVTSVFAALFVGRVGMAVFSLKDRNGALSI